MSSFGENLRCKDIRVTGKIDWTNADFVPPLSTDPVDIPTLAAVCEAGSDANGEAITGVSQLVMGTNTGAILNDKSISGVSHLYSGAGTFTTTNTALLNLGGDIECETGNATTFKGSVSGGGAKTAFTNCDFSDATNVQATVASDTLAEVLTAGNTANTNILMAGNNISGGGNYTAHSLSAVNTGNDAQLTVRASSGHLGYLNLYGIAGVPADTFISGDTTTDANGAVKKTICTNLNLSNSTNVFPALETATLATVLNNGNTASKEIAMAGFNVSNAGTVTTNTLNSTFEIKVAAQTGQLAGVNIVGDAGSADVDTFINGDLTTNAAGAVKNTKCKNLDLTDATNVFPAGLVGETLSDILDNGNNAGSNGIDMNGQNITNAASIGGQAIVATGTTANAGQVGAERQVVAPLFQITAPYSGMPVNPGIEFNSSITGTTEIRGVSVDNKTVLTNCDFSSSTNRQATPGESFEWGCYFYPTVGQSVVSDDEDKKDFDVNCYALTAASTDVAHRSQIISVQFHTTQYSWGTIFIGLDIADANGANKTGLTARCWYTRYPPKGVQTTDRQKTGCCTMTFFVRDDRFYDGNVHRIYPTVATKFDNSGEIRIHMGPNMDTNDPDDNATLRAAVIIQGKPAPNSWRIVDGNPGSEEKEEGDGA